MRAAILIAVGIILTAGFAFPLSHALAQKSSLSNFTNSPTLNSTQNTLPILAKISDKKHYLVEIRWEPSPQQASREFNLEVYFLNTTDAKATIASNSSSFGVLTSNQSQPTVNGGQGQYYTDSSGLERTVAVDTYDITLYDNSGHILYQKVNQPSQAGKGGQIVSVGNYTGPVTIQVANIKPMPGQLPGDPTDSVKFSATVVPEFPVAAVMLVAGIAAVAVVYRLAGKGFLPS